MTVLPLRITLTLTAVLALIVINAITLVVSLESLLEASDDVESTWSRVDALLDIKNNLVDAETGQRGFLLTRDPVYLQPYEKARATYAESIESLAQALGGKPAEGASLAAIANLAATRYEIIDRTIELGRQGDFSAAVQLVTGGDGKRVMDAFRAEVAKLERLERAALLTRGRGVIARFRQSTIVSLNIEALSLATLIAFYIQIRRNSRRRETAEVALRTANETLEARVADRTAELSFLSRQLLNAAETEKAALATEIHDELGSNLTAINLDVASVALRLQMREPDLAARLQRALAVLRETADVGRRIIQNLRPSLLDNMGLSHALRIHCEEFTRRTGVPCTAECPEDFGEMEPAWAIAFYRVAQESLNNITKHAKAQQVKVSLMRDAKGIRLRITDDGVGIDTSIAARSLSLGLLGMRERIAALGGVSTWRRGDNDIGTVVEAFIPFPGKGVSP
ncbi:MAG: CHASE3 domain-containing protein [Gammaproteobacteria bacterium]